MPPEKAALIFELAETMAEIAYWEILQQAVVAVQGKGIFSRKEATGRIESTLVEIKNRGDKRFEVRFLTGAKKLLGSVVLDSQKKVVGITGGRFKSSDVMECKAIIAAYKFLLLDKGMKFYSEHSIELRATKDERGWRLSFSRVPAMPGAHFAIVEDQQFNVKRLIRGR
ncbi:MAG: hypothetical protein QM758_27360 [Armatimonas sp.]